MELTATRQRLVASDADLSGSSFTNVNLSGAFFNDVNLAAATFTDANMAGTHIQNVTLRGSRISDANLAEIAIEQCALEGMTIDGISVANMMAAYRVAHPRPGWRQSDVQPVLPKHHGAVLKVSAFRPITAVAVRAAIYGRRAPQRTHCEGN